MPCIYISPSLCQLLCNYFSAPNPPFCHLLCDTDAGTVQVTSLFASWLLPAFANSASKGKLSGRSREQRCALSSQLPSDASSPQLQGSSSLPVQQLSPVRCLSGTFRCSLGACPPETQTPAQQLLSLTDMEPLLETLKFNFKLFPLILQL